MEDRTLSIPSKVTNKVELKVIPGHFMTSHSHTNCYIDTSPQTMNYKEAMKVAEYFANLYSNSIVIDTIVCLDGTEVIGAYLAELLSQCGVRSISEENNISVVTPETKEIEKKQPVKPDYFKVKRVKKGTLRLTIRTSSKVTGYYVYYRQKGDTLCRIDRLVYMPI